LKLFISYPSEHRDEVEPVVLALRNRGHKVFFDKSDLPPGQEYDDQIEAAIRSCTAMVVFVAPTSFAAGRYQSSELEIARRRWRSAHRHVLPVSLAATSLEDVPPYLKSVTILEPEGNLAAEVASAVSRLSRWNWKHVSTLVGVAMVAGLAITSTLLLAPSWQLPSEVTEQMASSVVDRVIQEADKVHIRTIVRPKDARPFIFVVYESGRDIVFATIKWRDGQWRLVRTIRDDLHNFQVSSWKLDVDLDSKSIVFSGCGPNQCGDVWGYLFYQFELDRGWLLKASSNESGARITAPAGLPAVAADLFEFEYHFYGAKVAELELELDPSIDAAILVFPRKRVLAPLWKRNGKNSDKDRSIERLFACALGAPLDTTIERIYREDVNGDGRAEWLVQTAADSQSSQRLYSVTGASPRKLCEKSLTVEILSQVPPTRGPGSTKANPATLIIEDPRDVDSAWTRLALYPIPGQLPYVLVGGYGGTGAMPFWYVSQATPEGRFARRQRTDAIEDMLNEAFPKFIEPQSMR
jgi:hypothetical protein